MFDPVQMVLLFVIVVLTFLLIILGIQVYFILREVRSALQKANRVLDTTEMITESVSEPMTMISGVVKGVRMISKLLGKDKEK